MWGFNPNRAPCPLFLVCLRIYPSLGLVRSKFVSYRGRSETRSAGWPSCRYLQHTLRMTCCTPRARPLRGQSLLFDLLPMFPWNACAFWRKMRMDSCEGVPLGPLPSHTPQRPSDLSNHLHSARKPKNAAIRCPSEERSYRKGCATAAVFSDEVLCPAAG